MKVPCQLPESPGESTCLWLHHLAVKVMHLQHRANDVPLLVLDERKAPQPVKAALLVYYDDGCYLV